MPKKRTVALTIFLASVFATTTALADAGSTSCDQINRPHDPKPVKNWLRGFVSASGYRGNYQSAASQIGALCQDHPNWSLSDAANFWLQDNQPRSADTSTTVNQQQIQQKQLIINVNPNISQ